MGNCMRYGSASATSSPTTASHIDAGVPHTTSKNTKSFKTSNLLNSRSLFLVSSGDESYPDGRILATSNLRRFSFKELKTATRNFKPENLLGEGEFGEVYKGWLRGKLHPQRRGGGTAVAIKKLKPRNKRRVTESEIDFLGRLSHPNLVKLLGYCSEDSELLLVYEFVQRGSLENHLFGSSVVQPLPWELRIKIAIGVARGVIFLHAAGERVIYGDMTAANILLDGVYNAKIKDFGLAKLGPSSRQRQIAPRIMGPFGYAAPEYVATGQLCVNSEVYCFGVVLAELLTGLQALDNRCSNGKQTLANWIKPYLLDKMKLQTIMDPTLDGKYPPKAVLETAKLVLSCLGQSPRTRPSMNEALETLENIQAIGKAEKERRKKPTRCNRQSPLASSHQFHRGRW